MRRTTLNRILDQLANILFYGTVVVAWIGVIVLIGALIYQLPQVLFVMAPIATFGWSIWYKTRRRV